MFAGVDGCKGGWIVAMAPNWPPSENLLLAICRNFGSVAALTATCSQVTVDMPIGLPEDRNGRECESEARQKLKKPLSNSVFPCPTRQATREPTWSQAGLTNEKMTGKSVGKQTFEIVPKIRDVDNWITPVAQRRVREFHPELVWKRYAGDALISKKTPEGIGQRVEILRALGFKQFEELKAWKSVVGAALKLDDLLDALAGLELANRIPDGATRIPHEPPTDSHGLRMEIWY